MKPVSSADISLADEEDEEDADYSDDMDQDSEFAMPSNMAETTPNIKDDDPFGDIFMTKTAPKKQKPKSTGDSRHVLTSLSELAKLGFGAGSDASDLTINEDDTDEDILSRLKSDFGEEDIDLSGEEAESFGHFHDDDDASNRKPKRR